MQDVNGREAKEGDIVYHVSPPRYSGRRYLMVGKIYKVNKKTVTVCDVDEDWGNQHVHSDGFVIVDHKQQQEGETDGLTFGQAIEALKKGERVARKGWNGKGMFVFKQIPATVPLNAVMNMTSLPDSVKDVFINREKCPNYCNQMAIVKLDGSIDSWVASSSDTFAEDWEIVTV